jgi:hypothetical protein
VKIRRAQEQDAALAQMHATAWRVACRGLVPGSFLEGVTAERREPRFRKALAALAEEDGRADGTAESGL